MKHTEKLSPEDVWNFDRLETPKKRRKPLRVHKRKTFTASFEDLMDRGG